MINMSQSNATSEDGHVSKYITNNDSTIIVADKNTQETEGLQWFAIDCHRPTYRNSLRSEPGITFHKFPDKNKQKELYLKWVKNCRRDSEPSDNARVCSRHFENNLINRTLQKAQLQEGAAPTIFDIPKYLLPKKPIKREPSQCAQEACGIATPSAKKDQVEVYISQEHTYHITCDDVKKRLLELKNENNALQLELRNVKLREKRLKATNANLRDKLDEAKSINVKLERELCSLLE